MPSTYTSSSSTKVFVRLTLCCSILYVIFIGINLCYGVFIDKVVSPSFALLSVLSYVLVLLLSLVLGKVGIKLGGRCPIVMCSIKRNINRCFVGMLTSFITLVFISIPSLSVLRDHENRVWAAVEEAKQEVEKSGKVKVGDEATFDQIKPYLEGTSLSALNPQSLEDLSEISKRRIISLGTYGDSSQRGVGYAGQAIQWGERGGTIKSIILIAIALLIYSGVVFGSGLSQPLVHFNLKKVIYIISGFVLLYIILLVLYMILYPPPTFTLDHLDRKNKDLINEQVVRDYPESKPYSYQISPSSSGLESNQCLVTVGIEPNIKLEYLVSYSPETKEIISVKEKK
jgi:hypothetical protein